MSKTPLDLAHEQGVKLALAQCGYSSTEEVEKEAAALGLTPTPKTAADNAINFLKKKLG